MNRKKFATVLERHYVDLFGSNPDYAFVKARTTPDVLAEKMTLGLASGNASKDGEGIKRTCKELGIPHTNKAIRAYLNEVTS